MNAPARNFEAKPAVRGEEPLSIGMVGPPGGGKTYSALRLATGIQRVRGGDIIVIDTEGGRARKLADTFKFLHLDLQPPHRSDHFLEAIKYCAAIERNPACIIVDSMSDEHEGMGGYLEWHDAEVPNVKGNEWAAWAKPKAARKRLIVGLIHVPTPLIFTFRAREKTAARPNQKGKTEIIQMGWQPVAPLEIVHMLDLTCILPPRADGVPVWRSDKIGEDFIIKLPEQFKKLFGGEARQLDEQIGVALATWARGGAASAAGDNAGAGFSTSPDPAPATQRNRGGHAAPSATDARAVASVEPHVAVPASPSIEQVMDAAAAQGMDTLKTAWMNLDPDERSKYKVALERRWKPTAIAADAGAQP